jgi:hypothetical protein
MELSKTVACTALILMILLAAGHALGQKSSRKAVSKKALACVIKPVMTDAEIESCRIAYRRPNASGARM